MPKYKEQIPLVFPLKMPISRLRIIIFYNRLRYFWPVCVIFDAMCIMIYKTLLLCSIWPRHHDKSIALQSEWCLTLTVSRDSHDATLGT